MRIFNTLLSFFALTGILDAEDLMPKINRRVLILDFVNQQKNDSAAYLSVSVPEALIDPLKKTKKFEILPRSNADKILIELKIQPNELFNEDKAILVAEKLQADVVVIGNYVAVEPNLQILAKAIDVHEKRIVVSKSKVAKLDATVFDTINILANDMSQDMAEKLPPLAQRVVYRDNLGGKWFDEPILRVMFGTDIVFPNESKYLNPSIGGYIDASAQFNWPWLQPYATAGFFTASGKTRIERMNFLFAELGLTYKFQFSAPRLSKNYLKDIEIRPLLSAGTVLGNIVSREDIRYNLPIVSAGLITDFLISQRISVSVSFKQHFVLEADTPLKIFSANLGAGYRI